MSGFDGLRPRHYRALYIDPPWRFSGGTRGRPQHYARMTDAELARMPIADLCHPEGCWLFMWSTSPKLPDAIALGRAWGFRFSARAFVWVKLNARETPLFMDRTSFFFGQGYTTRKNCEDVLLFRRGQPARIAKDVPELLIAPRREHSRKPDEAYDRIERLAAGPYAELFARHQRAGWDAWGNEKHRFNKVDAHV